MSKSYLKFHYALRPAKHIERLHLLDLLRRWTADRDSSSYRYIGMGSIYYVDYLLLHRELGTTDMRCYEIDVDIKERMSFNLPFDCIQLETEDIHEAVNASDFANKPTIVWLDYDFVISGVTLDNIRSFVRLLAPSSILLITSEAKLRSPDRVELPVDGKGLIKYFNSAFSSYAQRKFVPKGKDQFEFGTFLLDAIIGAVLDEASYRGRTCDVVTKFVYADGSPMATVGFIIGDSKEDVDVSVLSKSIAFRSQRQPPIEIVVPILTFKERQWFDRNVATIQSIQDVHFEITAEELDAMRQYYRYYPSYSEVRI